MDIRNLKTFVQVAELGSFSRAGERMGYSQPTVSVQIRQLEQELGFQLFDRVRLTDRGREMLLYAQEVCLLCQRMTMEPSQETPKPALIRLATADSLSTFLLQETFLRLRSQHPHIRLQPNPSLPSRIWRGRTCC